MQSVAIGKKLVGPGQPTFIVAEIGINHNGMIELAKQLIDMAVECGADAVKFQKRTVPVVYSLKELETPREVPTLILRRAKERRVLPQESLERLAALFGSKLEEAPGEELFKVTNAELKWALEFTETEYTEIDRYSKEKGILWFASPWDEGSVDVLERFNPPCYKIASPSLTDDNLLRHIRSKGRPIILSTGMSDLPMIEHAVEVLGRNDLVLLHCTSTYSMNKPIFPTDHRLGSLNLAGILTLRERFDIPVGFSSHDTGIVPTFSSVAMGGCAIEKHITLWRNQWGSDQSFSTEPREFRDLCRWIREHPVARGDGKIVIYPSERVAEKKLRRVPAHPQM